MDGLLRGKEQSEIENDITEICNKVYDKSANVVFFPVRHHSPACSYHIINVFNEYNPDAVLIEGPENAQELIQFAASKNTTAPFCFYSSFDDKSGKISDDKEKYRAYYPFLDFSPELVAMREATKRNIECRFIDLSYGEKLLNSTVIPKEEVQGLSDSEFLLGSFHEYITKELGCKSFSEAWEMIFEIDGLYLSTEQFIKNVFHYCYFTRMYSDGNEFEVNGDLARESVMLENIKKAVKDYNRVLVITGGMHTVALVQSYYNEDSGIKVKRLKASESPCYIMPYSFEESDRNFGYESGMVFPYFYQKAWESIGSKKKPYQYAVMSFIINTARTVRKKQALSIADEIQSYYMAKGLASLRDKKECGVYEAIDAVKSSFVKGEINSLYQPALKTLYRIMTGMNMGSVDSNAGVPPIINDFSEQCRKHKIQTNTSLKKSSKLDINNNPSHREKSYFFSQMDFLDTGFCKCIAGRDNSQSKSNRILLRETWEYKFSTSVQSALISASAYGGTVRQAAFSIISKRMRDKHSNTRDISHLLIQANYMGIDEVYSALTKALTDIISQDMDFFSVAEGFCNICEVKSGRKLLEESPIQYLDNTIALCFDRISTLIYTIINMKKDDEDRACNIIKQIYSYIISEGSNEQNDKLLECMKAIYNDREANGALSGISAGILYKKSEIELQEVMNRFNSYIGGSSESKKLSASFLKGFFKVARDAVFVNNNLLISLDNILNDVSGDLFLEILPDLRLAFTDFMLYETDKIALTVSEFYNVSQSSVLYAKTYDQKDLEEAYQTDLYCKELINEWLL